MFQQYSCPAILARGTGHSGQKLQEEAISRILCTRGGVHSSWPSVTERLQQPTRKSFPPKRGAGTGDPRLPYSVLLRMGFTVPPPLPEGRCALTAPFHPYPPTSGGRSALCGTFPRVATAGRYPACCPSGVRTFLPRHEIDDSERPPPPALERIAPTDGAGPTSEARAARTKSESQRPNFLIFLNSPARERPNRSAADD